MSFLRSLIGILKSLEPKSIDPEDKLSIDVRRECVLEDAIREGKKRKFNCHKYLKVLYLGFSISLLCKHSIHLGNICW